ncbi:MFS transporter [Cohnella candidum]|uniref:MFS transporter n=1 Tax=Cohnella candidum TaxID=2674991 RepID=A0A3G3JXM5_9BACL|nr:MFS transporter [Cohnella candidum]AYQ73000.1 MFS transporter [Cohnella candidum]
MDKQNSQYRWVVFAAVLFTYLLIVTQRTAPGLISDQLMNEFHVTASTIGLLASVQFLAYAGLQIPVGIFSDRFGPNRFLIAGTLLNGIGTIIYSLAPNESILLMARLLVGIGDSTIWINLVLILSQWFKAKEFIGLIGMAGVSGSLGFLTATVPFSLWIAATSWHVPFLITGCILCLVGILLYFVLVVNTRKMTKATPSNMASSGKEKLKREPTLVLLRRIFAQRQTWATFFCHFGLVGTYVGFIGSWAVPYGMHVYGMSRSGASQLIMIGLFGAILGAPLSSWISGRLGSIKRPYTVVHVVVFLSWGIIFLSGGKPPFMLLAVLFFLIGFGNGASSLTFGVVRESFAVQEVGVVSGIANTGGFVSAVLLPSLFGKVLDHFQSSSVVTGYRYGILIIVCFTLIGLVGSVLIKERTLEDRQAAA